MDGEMTRIFIGRLSPRTQERDIENIFSAYGKVKRVDLKEGYAFVFFSDEKNALESIAAMNNKELDGNMIVVEPAHNNSKPRNSNGNRGNTELRLSCRNLDPNTSWQDLKDWARVAGKVTFANVFTRDSQKLGVIEFETTSDVQNALQTLEDVPCHGSLVRLEKEDPNETGGFTSGRGGDRRAEGGGGANGGYGGRDLRERDRGGDSRDSGVFAGRRGNMGSVDYRNGEGNGRGDDRLAARDRDRGEQRSYDPRVTVDRYDGRERDSGANRYVEPSRYSDDIRRGTGPGPSSSLPSPARGYYRGEERRDVAIRREAPARSRSRSRGRGDRDGGREWSSTDLPPSARFRATEPSQGYKGDSRGGSSQYDDYASRGDARGESRGDHRGGGGGGDGRGEQQRVESRGDHRGDSRSDPRGDVRGGGGEYSVRRASAPSAAYRGDVGYERGSGDAYEGRGGGGGGYDRR